MRKKYTESFAQDENHKMVNAKGKKIKWYKNGEEDSYLMSEEENPDQEEDLLDEEKQEQEMLVLANKYPALRDANSPLREAAIAARAALINQGAQPGPATDLEAVKYAILDNPQIATPSPPTPVTPAPAQIDGDKRRRVSPPNVIPPKMTPRALEIAKRMGVKDPEKSLERFYKRQEAGRSAVSPLIQTIVREE